MWEVKSRCPYTPSAVSSGWVSFSRRKKQCISCLVPGPRRVFLGLSSKPRCYNCWFWRSRKVAVWGLRDWRSLSTGLCHDLFRWRDFPQRNCYWKFVMLKVTIDSLWEGEGVRACRWASLVVDIFRVGRWVSFCFAFLSFELQSL